MSYGFTNHKEPTPVHSWVKEDLDIFNPRFASFLEGVVPNSPEQIIFLHSTLPWKHA